jgi:outer membrane receptor protein involved in Fe transport
VTRHALFVALSLAIAQSAAAQNAPPPTPGEGEARSLDAIVVQAEINYRDRTEATAPVLAYDLEYFQRFEPLTVGDMLKRVPSVAFVSDVLEYDGARLRGLDPGYTQILINGKKVPGAGDDRSFFVDRIPAELVDRIEIIRATSANRSGDAVAGALNIVLRDAYEFDGAYVRAGLLNFRDGEHKGSFGAVGSGEFAGGRLLAGVNVQGRYNPKQKRSDRFEAPGGDFDDREDQDDTRDGTDTSANLSFVTEVGAGELSLSGFYVRTEREETEFSVEYNDPLSISPDNRLSLNNEFEDIEQDNYGASLGFNWLGFGGDNKFELDYAGFDESSRNTESEIGFDDDDFPPSFDEFEGARELLDIEDRELAFGFSHERRFGLDSALQIGVDWQDKRREVELQISEVDTDEEGAPLPPFVDFDSFASRIDEQRLDPYLMVSGEGESLKWEAGLRYETTDSEVRVDGERFDNDYNVLLPSAHLAWSLSDDDRLRLSLSRSVRRPDFNLILPIQLEGEFGDNDFLGNPLLDLEKAWGVDLGFERRLGTRGVIGVNVFYRDVQDLIEVVNTGAPSETAVEDFEEEIEEFLDENPGATPDSPGYPQFDPDSFVFTAGNVGDGYVYGIEFDLSTPLDLFGLPQTGLFLNYAWLDSEIEDFAGDRRFNDQARYVYNVGFIHDLESMGASFGLSYRRQGDAESRILAEEVRTSYGADLEAFIEKRFGNNLSIRLTGSNLLDASKDEIFNKFDTLGDQLDREFDEFELETEQSGRVYQLIARYAF